MQQYEQKNLSYFPILKEKTEILKYKLSLCGKYATKNFYCKHCESEGSKNSLLKTTRSKFFCEIRYCDNPECLVQRFARQVETFNDVKRFHGLKKLWHFTIGFKPISELDFKKNFSKYNKRFQYVLNKYFEKLRKQGLKIEAVRVLDFSFVTDGQVYLHFHFGAVPLGQKNIRKSMLLMQKVRKQMISRMKIETPFYFKDFGLASKKGVLSYLSIRASGMYKYNMTENTKYKHIESNLKSSIENKKYILLKNVLTEEEYLKSFYNKPFYVTVGGLPKPPRHGSNITDTIPSSCSKHGILKRQDIRIEVIFEENDIGEAPPPPPLMTPRQYPDEIFEIVKI